MLTGALTIPLVYVPFIGPFLTCVLMWISRKRRSPNNSLAGTSGLILLTDTGPVLGIALMIGMGFHSEAAGDFISAMQPFSIGDFYITDPADLGILFHISVVLYYLITIAACLLISGIAGMMTAERRAELLESFYQKLPPLGRKMPIGFRLVQHEDGAITYMPAEVLRNRDKEKSRIKEAMETNAPDVPAATIDNLNAHVAQVPPDHLRYTERMYVPKSDGLEAACTASKRLTDLSSGE